MVNHSLFSRVASEAVANASNLKLPSAAAQTPPLNDCKVSGEENMSISSIEDSLDAKEVTFELTEKSPEDSEIELSDKIQSSENVDFGNVLEGIVNADANTATDAILSLATVGDERDLPIKGVVDNPAAYSAAQVLADYNDSLGLTGVGNMLRSLCSWKIKHNCGFKGERAKLAFNALSGEKEKEFQLEKEAKGVVGK